MRIVQQVFLDHLFKIWDKKPRFILTFILFLTIILTPPFYRVLPTMADRFNINDAYLDIPNVGTGFRNGFAYYIDPNKRNDDLPYKFGTETLNNLPTNSIVISEWFTDTDEYFVLRHFTKVEQLRPDVTVFGWMTIDPASFDPQLAMDVIEKSFPEHPVYLASLSERFYASSKLIEMYCIMPENNLYRLYTKEDDSKQCLGIESITE